MIALALIAGLLAPEWEIGAGAGGAVVADEVNLVFTPWAGLRVGEFAGALHGPLRLDLSTGEPRQRDWDEAADFGRIVRFIRYGLSGPADEGLRVGQLADVTLGEGTLVRRYHNGIDDDHYRVGARATYRTQTWGLDAFSDQLLGSPVAGARLHWTPLDWLTVAATGAADFEFPTRLKGTVDSKANLRADTAVFAGYGAEAIVALPTGSITSALYVAANLLDESDLGTHFGARATVPAGRFQLRLRGEAARLGAGYDNGWFDAGYLIDRWRGKANLQDGLETAWGGRGEVEVEYAKALLVGAAYTDAAQAGRAGLMTWVRVPTEALQVGVFYRNRYPEDRAGLLDPDESLAAAAVTVHVDPWWWFNVTLARVWRVDEEAVRYTPFTEVSLTFEGLFGPR